MQKITADSNLSALILQTPSLVPVLFLTGIRGELQGKTIRQVCKEKAINESYLLNLLKVFTDERFAPVETLPSYSVLQMTALVSSLYPFYLSRLDLIFQEIQKCLNSFGNEMLLHKEEVSALKVLSTRYRMLVSNVCEDFDQTVLPHIQTVYELYYSPDYTSERTGLITYSLEFYDGKPGLMESCFHELKGVLERFQESRLAGLELVLQVNEFYRLNEDLVILDRMVQKLLKPLVLQMEESIITTYRKRNKTFRRSNFLSMPAGSPPSDVLTPREREVLQLVAHGCINKEIADRLQIGLTTVISHRKNIIEKLGIRTVSGLTVYAYTQGYLDDPVPGSQD
jgi:DNA-binding CsgD family transcriptional regulator